MTEADYLWFQASCPHCGSELTRLRYPRELWGLGGALGSETVACPGCGEQVAARQDLSSQEPRLVVSMHTMPAGAPSPEPVVARQVDPPDSPAPEARAETIDELFARVVEPWREANRDAETPDYAALHRALEPYTRWRAEVWRDVGRSGPFGSEETAWLRAQQCYVQALCYDSHPEFLAWDRGVNVGEAYWDKDAGRTVEKDPVARALNERAGRRAELDDAGRERLVAELRAYVGAPGEPLPTPKQREAALGRAPGEPATEALPPPQAAERRSGRGGLLDRLLGRDRGS